MSGLVIEWVFELYNFGWVRHGCSGGLFKLTFYFLLKVIILLFELVSYSLYLLYEVVLVRFEPFRVG